MYRPTKPVEKCQCCQQRVAFANAHGAPNFFRDDHAPQVVNSANNTGCFHILKLLCIKIVLCYFLHEKRKYTDIFRDYFGRKNAAFHKKIAVFRKKFTMANCTRKKLKICLHRTPYCIFCKADKTNSS